MGRIEGGAYVHCPENELKVGACACHEQRS